MVPVAPSPRQPASSTSPLDLTYVRLEIHKMFKIVEEKIKMSDTFVPEIDCMWLHN